MMTTRRAAVRPEMRRQSLATSGRHDEHVTGNRKQNIIECAMCRYAWRLWALGRRANVFEIRRFKNMT